MSRPAHYAAFNSHTLALIDKLRLSPEEVIGLGLSLAASYTVANGLAQSSVSDALQASFAAAETGVPGIVIPKGATN